MKFYSQFGEDKAIVSYFGSKIGRCLDIGAYDGIVFSNTRALIQSGWSAVLVDPGVGAFSRLLKLYAEDSKVELLHGAIRIDTDVGFQTIWERDEYTTLDKGMRDAAPGYWLVYKTAVVHPKVFHEYGPFDFISIDTDGNSIEIVEALDLFVLGIQLICVEYNGIAEDRERVVTHCRKHKLERVVLDTTCNILIGR